MANRAQRSYVIILIKSSAGAEKPRDASYYLEIARGFARDAAAAMGNRRLMYLHCSFYEAYNVCRPKPCFSVLSRWHSGILSAGMGLMTLSYPLD